MTQKLVANVGIQRILQVIIATLCINFFTCSFSLAQAQSALQLSSELAIKPLPPSFNPDAEPAPSAGPTTKETTSVPPTPAIAAKTRTTVRLARSEKAEQVNTEQAAPNELPNDNQRIPTIDLTTPPDDLLQRLRNGFSMPDLHSPLVTERQAWYLNNPTYIKRVIERSRKYLHHIITELEKRGMPTELALLPIVESSFNPQAYSSARALGMWQFIPSTGRNYRLRQNWWLDERRDIIASTNAALDYLRTIYEMHGDWHLALASYNWGEGAVGKAIARNKAKGLPTDYLSLTMPGETRYYVPKLQAIKNIIANPELYGIKLDPIPNRPYFATVEKPGDMDVSLAAKFAEIPVDEFIALNPAYQRPVIPGNSTTPLIIPADKVKTFMSNLELHEAQDKPLSVWTTYKLGKGEKLDSVAARTGMTTARLKQINGITARTRVGPGFTLLVPTEKDQIGSSDAKLPTVPGEASAKAAKGKKGKKASKGSAKKKSGSKSKSAAKKKAKKR